ncbi:tagatose 1,6-diphosphate aldolase [Thermogemmatispora carboxidivorans]|uniref:tagatose 1,6-diphosphate aldolase n=1 Tax=Thermogemmatispora carboxidivorans TaxID=1382306 RepID=UPI000A9854EC|nr:tagatose 1,6-diphosphate aldolase [Thermogemmatispora carboxidivorans]
MYRREDLNYTSIENMRNKLKRLRSCADEHGIITALAIDHRTNLAQALAVARGSHEEVSASDLGTFKRLVTRILSPYASAVLLDPEYGLDALAVRHPSTGVILAYERSGYSANGRYEPPEVIPDYSVRRLVEVGAQAIKVLLHYNPFDSPDINRVKQAYVERIGAECQALEVPFFLEPLVYPGKEIAEEDAELNFAQAKPTYVVLTVAEFGQPRYGVDVLKVEWPIVPTYTAGLRSCRASTPAYSREEAIELLRAVGIAASKPLVYLSAGYSAATVCELLELTAEAGVPFCGMVCGRALWQEGISLYAREGSAALERWLAQEGVATLQTIARVLHRCATPWWQLLPSG